MRNLKKILALVLALVMSLSLMATAGAAETASADSTDPYATAKTVLEKLSVFKGNPDGSMNYDQSVTRVQTAALVYRIATSDVTDTQKDMYTNHAFKDVAPTYWGNGYIGYGYNAEIIKGMGDGTFHPDDNVTGYQVLAMILRTLGYGRNHEFEGTNWEIQTAATAKREGLLNGITAADETRLGQPASRGLVAQILFNALLQPTVKFSALYPNNYEKDADTLGYQKFKLEKVTGVVVANEYANLYGDSTIAANTTRLRENGKDYTLADTKTTLDDIGESRLAYITGTKVLAIADSGLNKTDETVDEKKLSALETNAGITSDAGAEHFINFGKGTNWTSDWRIRYEITLDTGYATDDFANVQANVESAIKAGRSLGFNLPDAYEATTNKFLKNGYTLEKVTVGTVTTYTLVYSQTFKIGEDIGPAHQNNIEKIFNIADKTVESRYIYGEVYAGTTSMKDLSDTITFAAFKQDYIKTDDWDGVSANENGNWLKVIDNDADGVADYVLKVIYTMAQVVGAKDEKYTLDVQDHTLGGAAPCGIDALNNIGSKTAVSDETLEVGDVVYYALIDGKVQAYKAETKTVSFNDVNRNAKTAVTTDGETLTQSAVCNHIADEAYESGVTNIAGKVSYDIFLDRGGYLAAFVKTDKVGQFKLITDGWYNSVKTGKEYAVKIYNDETGLQETVDVLGNGGLFISNGVSTAIQNNNWGALKFLGGVDGASALVASNSAKLNGGSQHKNTSTDMIVGNSIHTAVAALSADGTILPVENGSVSGRYSHVMIDLPNNAVPTSLPVKGNAYITTTGSYTAYNKYDGEVELRALTSTVYYLVYPNANGDLQVTRTVGYANAPDVASLAKKGYVEDIYAVGTGYKRDNSLTNDVDFYTADVVVVELNKYDDQNELILVVDDESRLTDVNYRDLTVIRADGTTQNLTIDYAASYGGYTNSDAGKKEVQPGLYWLYKTGTEGIYTISGPKPLTPAEIAATGRISAGQVKQYRIVNGQEYVAMYNWFSDMVPAGTNSAYRGPLYDAKKVNGTDGSADPHAVENTYTISSDTPMYKLSYSDVAYDVTMGTGSYATSGKANLSSTTHADALKGQVNVIPNTSVYRDNREGLDYSNLDHYNYNDVMMYCVNGKVVYAVSFENVKTDAVTGTTWNYAQTVWENVIPDRYTAVTHEPLVTLGVMQGSEFVRVYPTADNTYMSSTSTNSIPYSVWSKHVNEDVVIKVIPAANNEIAVEGDSKTWSDIAVTVKDWTTADSTKIVKVASGVTDKIDVQSRGKYAQQVSKSYRYTYVFEPGEEFNTLNYTSDPAVVMAPASSTADNTLTMPGNANLQEFVENYFEIPAKATAEFFFTTKDGKNDFSIKVAGGKADMEGVTKYATNTGHIDSTFTVIVTSETGDPKGYAFNVLSADDIAAGKKLLVIELEDGIALPGAPNENYKIIETPTGYVIEVEAADDAYPVVVINGNVVGLMTKPAPAALLSNIVTWTYTLTAADLEALETVNVIYIRARQEGDPEVPTVKPDTTLKSSSADVVVKSTADGKGTITVDLTKIKTVADLKAVLEATDKEQATVTYEPETATDLTKVTVTVTNGTEKRVYTVVDAAEAPEQVTVTYTAAGTGYTVAVKDKDGNAVENNGKVDKGTELTITVIPATDYSIVSVKDGTTPLTANADKTYTVKADANVAIAVEVKKDGNEPGGDADVKDANVIKNEDGSGTAVVYWHNASASVKNPSEAQIKAALAKQGVNLTNLILADGWDTATTPTTTVVGYVGNKTWNITLTRQYAVSLNGTVKGYVTTNADKIQNFGVADASFLKADTLTNSSADAATNASGTLTITDAVNADVNFKQAVQVMFATAAKEIKALADKVTVAETGNAFTTDYYIQLDQKLTVTLTGGDRTPYQYDMVTVGKTPLIEMIQCPAANATALTATYTVDDDDVETGETNTGKIVITWKQGLKVTVDGEPVEGLFIANSEVTRPTTENDKHYLVVRGDGAHALEDGATTATADGHVKVATGKFAIPTLSTITGGDFSAANFDATGTMRFVSAVQVMLPANTFKASIKYNLAGVNGGKDVTIATANTGTTKVNWIATGAAVTLTGDDTLAGLGNRVVVATTADAEPDDYAPVNGTGTALGTASKAPVGVYVLSGTKATFGIQKAINIIGIDDASTAVTADSDTDAIEALVKTYGESGTEISGAVNVDASVISGNTKDDDGKTFVAGNTYMVEVTVTIEAGKLGEVYLNSDITFESDDANDEIFTNTPVARPNGNDSVVFTLAFTATE